MTDTPAAPAATPGPLRRRAYLPVLLAILILATGLRVYRLGAESLWIDELLSLQLSAGYGYGTLRAPPDVLQSPAPRPAHLDGAPPPWHVWTSLDDDPHPPLYYVLLRVWREAFGSSDAAMRSLSVVFSLTAVLLVFDVGRLLFGPGAALWAGLLAALAQSQIWFAQEVRGYALLTAAGVAAMGALLRIERTPPGRWPAFWPSLVLVLSLLTTMLTHYFGVAGCAALALYTVLRLRGRTLAATLGLMALAAAIYAVIWGPFLLRQLSFTFDNVWQRDVGPGFHARWAGHLLLTTISFFAAPATTQHLVGSAATVILVLPFLLLRRRPALLLPALWAMAWVSFPAAIDLSQQTVHLKYIRYVVAGAPGVFLVAAGLLWQPRGWLRHAVPAALALHCLVSLNWTYSTQKVEWERLALDAGRLVQDDDVIVYHTPPARLYWLSGVMHTAVDHYAPHIRPDVVYLTGPAPKTLLARLAAKHAVWLATQLDDPDVPTLLPGYAARGSYYAWGVGRLVRLERLVPSHPVSAAAATAPSGAGTGTNSIPTTRNK